MEREEDAVNRQKHGISFEEATKVFFDPLHSEIFDVPHSGFFEDRWKAFGLVGSALVMVSYTIRGGRIRLISARKTKPAEKETYHGNG